MDQDELADKYDAVLNGEKVEDEEQRTYTYDELLNLSFIKCIKVASLHRCTQILFHKIWRLNKFTESQRKNFKCR